MQFDVNELFGELRSLVGSFGENGGLITPAIYDTAQVLRLSPIVDDVDPVLDWLLAQQEEDGGWGAPHFPPARDIPTLAAILAIRTYRRDEEVQAAITAGFAFLARQASQWQNLDMALLPIAGEMILPRLLEEAVAMGFEIDLTPYKKLFAWRQQKLERIADVGLLHNSAPTFSWEALGMPYDPALLDPLYGVGHSPAATAAWLNAARANHESEECIAPAEAYLHRAAGAISDSSPNGLPGLLPIVYPITSFELAYGLYALLLTGLLGHPFLHDVVEERVDEMAKYVNSGGGLSFGERFVPDVDGTSVGMIVLRATGRKYSSELVRRFWRGEHFYTYVHELNPSVFSNAHALHALVSCGERCEITERFLIERQQPDGAWVVDKWHTSWRSSTLEVMASLIYLGYEQEVLHAVNALIVDQNDDGSWGKAASTRLLETSYALIALNLAYTNLALARSNRVRSRLQRGCQWLEHHIHQRTKLGMTWLGKEIYSVERVDRTYALAAVLQTVLTLQKEPISDATVGGGATR